MVMNDRATVSMIETFQISLDVETAHLYLEDQRWCGHVVYQHCSCDGNITVCKGKYLRSHVKHLERCVKTRRPSS